MMTVSSDGNSKARLLLKRLVSLPKRYVKIVYLFLKIRGRTLRWSLRRFNKLVSVALIPLLVGFLTIVLSWQWNQIASDIRSTDSQILTSLLIGVATVIAGVLALLFSVSLFVIQNAADNYTPTILERFAREKVSVILYSVIGVSSLLVFCSSLLVKTQSVYAPALVVGSLGLLALTFGLAFLQYRRMAAMINPLSQLRDWRKECLGYIRNVDRNMDESVQWLNLRQNAKSPQNLKAQDYEGLSKAGFYLLQQSIHTSLEKRLGQIYAISKRAAIKRDYEVLESGLASVSDVLKTYLAARRDSTVPLLTTIPLSFSVDYDSLFDRSFQELLEICRIAIANADENLIRRIVDTIASIGMHSVTILPKGDFPRNNPITGLSVQYINAIVEEASRRSYTDACLSGVDGIRAIVQNSLANKVPLVFEEARESLKKIAFIGLVHRKSYIVDKVMETLGAISHQVVQMDHFHAEGIVQNCLEDAKTITVLSLPLIEETGLQGSMSVTNYLGSFYGLAMKTAIPYVTRMIPNRFMGKNADDRDAMKAFHDFIGVNKLLWRFYRDIGEEIGKTESFMLFHIHEAIKENVTTILAVLQDDSWTFERKELESLVSWHLSFYWVAFEAHRRITKNLYLDMIDFLASLGIRSIKDGWLGIADSCVQNISSIAKDYIEKGDGFQFDAPRIFMKDIYVLMVANKKPFCKKISDLVVDELNKFHSSYVAKLTASDSTGGFLHEFNARLLVEIRQLLNDFRNGSDQMRTLHHAQDLLFKEVDDSDFAAIETLVKAIVDPPKSAVS